MEVMRCLNPVILACHINGMRKFVAFSRSTVKLDISMHLLGVFEQSEKWLMRDKVLESYLENINLHIFVAMFSTNIALYKLSAYYLAL